jgi:hypothetical protein
MKTEEEIKKLPQFQKAVNIGKSRSAILTEKVSRSIYETPFMPEVKSNVELHHVILCGGSDGKFIRDQKTQDSLILQNTRKQQELVAQINRWRQDRLNTGRSPNEPLAEHLIDKKIELLAQQEVYKLEREKLEAILKEFSDKVEQETSEKMLKGRLGRSKMKPVVMAGSKLPVGMVDYIDGQKCGLKDGLLHITDERSPYNNMVLHRYIGFIAKPFMNEWEERNHKEEKAFRKEGREYKKPSRPVLPKWDSKTDEIEYPNYSEKIINKFKS